jgi:hypothetical protein
MKKILILSFALLTFISILLVVVQVDYSQKGSNQAENESIKEPETCPILCEQTYTNVDGENFLTLKSNQERVLFQFDNADTLSNGFAVVTAKGKRGFLDKTGKIMIKPIDEGHVTNFAEGLAKVEVNGKYAFIDKKGNLANIPQFDLAFDFTEGLARIWLKNKV